jgi:hypothetical protein
MLQQGRTSIEVPANNTNDISLLYDAYKPRRTKDCTNHFTMTLSNFPAPPPQRGKSCSDGCEGNATIGATAAPQRNMRDQTGKNLM